MPYLAKAECQTRIVGSRSFAVRVVHPFNSRDLLMIVNSAACSVGEIAFSLLPVSIEFC